MFKAVERKSNQRLVDWYNFRQQLESSTSPLDDVHQYFQNVPKVKIYTDPYDQATWPTAWELINENEYCPFNIILAICYTLQLTSRFKNTTPVITITIDKINKTVYYMLCIDDKVYGFDENGWIPAKTLPKTLTNLKIYNMAPLQ
jgi:hypothetical protein